ncbi:MAG TPA: hypothetical protein VNQ90_03540 [Chthoniobacteraceae bacterium]|nr:hypothetical protein [Chthoniobacteraceae bacterium]
MCVIAGYLGKEAAAPILLEMLRREEGLAGGFSTGIVTLHEGVLHHAKVVGDVETLIAATPALQLPGTVGIAHSRTPGGGGATYAHPFIDTFQRTAYIANSGVGPYKGRVDTAGAAKDLLERGYGFSTACGEPFGACVPLPDGRYIHPCDLRSQAISAGVDALPDEPLRLLQAAMETHRRLPASILGVCLHTDHPDEIVAVRHTKPLELGRLGDGSYVLASSTMAFPQGVQWHFHAPSFSGVRIHREQGVQVVPCNDPALLPLGLPPSAAAVAEAVVGLLERERQVWIHTLLEAVVPLWPAGGLNEKEMVVFPLIAALRAEGKVELCTERVPGVEPGLTAPRTIVHWRGR